MRRTRPIPTSTLFHLGLLAATAAAVPCIAAAQEEAEPASDAEDSREPEAEEIAPEAEADPEAESDAAPDAADTETQTGTAGEPAGPPSAEPASDGDDDPSVRAARRHYRQGAAFFRNERYSEAIAEFMEAYTLWSNPTVLYSLGQAYERMLRAPQAIRFYERYLEQSPEDDPRREEVALQIRALRMLLGTVRIESNVPAVVLANGEEVGDAPGELQLTTGQYRIELRAEGYEPAEQRLTLAVQTDRTLSFELEPVEPRQLVVEEQGGVEPGWFWAGVVGTAVGAVTSGILGGVTLDLAAAYESDPMRTAAMQSEGQRMALATDVTLGITGAFAIATVVLGLVTRWDAPAREDEVAEGSAAAVRWRRTGIEVVW